VALESSVLRLENVGYRTPDGAEILREISFVLAPGTLTFITGHPGSGKTTLLRLCHFRARPSRGEIFLLGANLQKANAADLPSLRRRIGVVFEDLRLMDHLSAFENVALPLHLAGQQRSNYAKDVQELLTWAGLGGKLHDKISLLSAGEKQRVAIARALAGKPDLLLADEPLIRLDDAAGERVMRLLLNIHRFGTTVLIATSKVSPIARSAGRELRLADGCITEAGTAA
jgi:cell division transport system ATP-binding protein